MFKLCPTSEPTADRYECHYQQYANEISPYISPSLLEDLIFLLSALC
jgi:hypothetical protein